MILTGTLGAGKTYFTGCLLRALGLDREIPVTSPTYALVSEYVARDGAREQEVCHADLYRLASADEVEELGLLERREQGALLVVEWGAPYIVVLGGRAIELSFTVEPRSVTVVSSSERAEHVARALTSLG